MRIMAITDRRRFGASDGASVDELIRLLTAFATSAARAGIDVVQVRERDLPDGPLSRCVAAMVSAVAGSSLRILVNDRAHVVPATGAAGVHLRASSMSASRARASVGAAALVGRSVHDQDDLAPVEMEGVDYLLFGTVFPSASKGPGHPTAGLDRLEACCRRAGRPVLAIGGITVAGCRAAARRGASGVAAIGIFAEAWRQGGTVLDEVVSRMHERLAEAETWR